MIVRLCIKYTESFERGDRHLYDNRNITLWWWGGEPDDEFMANPVAVNREERIRYLRLFEEQVPYIDEDTHPCNYYLRDGYVCTDREVLHDS